MAAIKVFIDGREGTTGLQIEERLSARDDVELLEIDPALRKEPAERRRLMERADLVFFCLPDDAARESASLAEGTGARVIDASTAFRTDPDWVYGLPELGNGQRERIKAARRLSNPGCHATAFILAVAPLVKAGIASPEYPFSATSITGYSGAGKKLITVYESADADRRKLQAPRPYALSQAHKHLPEMVARTGIVHPPVFLPIVGPFPRGMAVSVPVAVRLLARPMGARGLRDFYAERYAGEPFVRVLGFDDPADLDQGFLDPVACDGTNRADILVSGNDERILVTVRLDNLGKGASGAAVQNMNIMFGIDEGAGLSA